MTVLSPRGIDNCHVWLGSSSLCTCEAHRGPSGPTLAMYGHPMNYNPFGGPHAPQQPTSAPDVPQARLSAAERAGATHLSGDGMRAFVIRLGECCQANWIQEDGKFGSWWRMGGNIVPPDAVVLK